MDTYCLLTRIIVAAATCCLPLGCSDLSSSDSMRGLATELNDNRSVSCSDPVWNFGTTDGTLGHIEHEFVLMNKSQSSITVSDVQVGCGCLLVGDPPSVIPAEATVALPVKVNLLGYIGPFRKGIHVLFSDNVVDSIELRIVGEIRPPGGMLFTPSELNFGRVPRGHSTSRRFQVESADGSPLSISNVEANSQYITCDWDTSVSSPISIVVTLSAKNNAPVRIDGAIAVTRRGYENQPMELPYRAIVDVERHGIVERVFLRALSPGDSAYVDIQSEGNSNTIESVKYRGDPGLSCKLATASQQGGASRRIEIAISDSVNSRSARVLQGELRVKLMDETTLDVPLVVVVSTLSGTGLMK